MTFLPWRPVEDFWRAATIANLRGFVCGVARLFDCHHPRKRVIEYAEAPRLLPAVSGILGRPVKPGDDDREGRLRPYRLHFSNSQILRSHSFAISRRGARVVQEPFASKGGRGECRMPNAPIASRANWETSTRA